MKYIFTLILISTFVGLQSQEIVADFENFEIEMDTFLNGSDGTNLFESGEIILPNDYNAEWESWSGWAISSTTDTLTPGFNNQYSAIAGMGVNASNSYAVTFASPSSSLKLQTEDDVLREVKGLYITNSTYAYKSIQDGDSFAKKFGGETGDDPDFFLLKIKGFIDGVSVPDSVLFYLADYRFADNSLDYIVKDWTYVNLQFLGVVDSLEFSLFSSDVGQFGMNTPAYFCIDDITTNEIITPTNELNYQSNITMYPNPVQEKLFLENIDSEKYEIAIYNVQGQVVYRDRSYARTSEINLAHLNAGTYILETKSDNSKSRKLFIKE